MDRVRSAVGLLLLLLLAYALCPRARRRHVKVRTVVGGLIVLFAVGVLVLKTPARGLFVGASRAFDVLLACVDRGSEFVFGHLARGEGALYVFAFRVLPTIVFFAALCSLLYYLRVLPFIVRVMGRALSRVLGTSGAESFSTVSDVFVGQTEAPLTIRPYLARLTLSELHACMVAGFATTAGGVLAFYVAILRDLVPDVAGHLLACSVMCAPASLVVAKLLLPETERPETGSDARVEIPSSGENALDALTIGTTDGLKLALNVGAMLVTFVAATALINGILAWAFPASADGSPPLDLARIFGKLFWPLAWATGAPLEDVSKVATLLGEKTTMTELIAYVHLSEGLKADPHWLTERGRVVASYALCGFANFASIGIQIGGYAALVPERRADLSRLALRAMFGGMLTTLVVACLAGVLL
jgi:concentrative nucleoside transporter, CNT family